MTSMEADQVLNYWQAIEHLQPAPAPDSEPAKYCWRILGPNELPWIDSSKRLPRPGPEDRFRWEFVVHIGLLDMKWLAARTCELLGVEQPDKEKDRAGKPSAVIAIQVGLDGAISAAPALSSMPWAIGQVKAASAGAALSFDGFFGEGGFEDTTTKLVKELLLKREAERFKPEDESGSDIPSDDGVILNQAGGQALPSEQPRRLPLYFEDFLAVRDLVLERTGCPEEFRFVEPLRVQAVKVSLKREPGDREPQAILNSFLAPDLRVVRSALAQAEIGEGLRAYMSASARADRIDVIRDNDGRAVIEATMPARLPPGRWPSRHPMVLAQQFAVNTIRNELFDTSGIFSVNGPPGTGKTTMLRDIVALLVVERAKVLASFAKPGEAFVQAGAPVRGEKPGTMHPIDERLRGFGLVVACLNNGAAQNVTRELPASKSIDAEGVELDYFAAVAETLLASPKDKRRRAGSAWGMIAAVLGNSELRTHFTNRFWFANSGKSSVAKAALEEDEFVNFRTLLDSGVPGARPWTEQRERFKGALRRSEAALQERQQLADTLERRGILQRKVEAETTQHGERQKALSVAHQEHDRASIAQAVLEQEFRAASSALASAKAFSRAMKALADHIASMPERATIKPTFYWPFERIQCFVDDLKVTSDIQARVVEDLDQCRPGALARLFNTRGFRAWCAARSKAVGERNATDMLTIEFARWADDWPDLKTRFDQATARLGIETEDFSLARYEAAFQEVEREFERGLADHRLQTKLVKIRQNELDQATQSLRSAQHHLDQALDTIARSGFDEVTLSRWQMASLPERDRQHQAPWSDATLDRLRHEVFVEAMELHKSFIARNAWMLKRNLGQMIDLLSGKLAPGCVEAGVGHLWDSLFLCVPVVSTTFASMASVFKGMGRESFGWLFIDEAGQAPPQAAAGAIWRSKRTLVVGDPLQLEPVVTIPARVVDALEDRLGLSADWNPRATSAQVLADRVNRYGTLVDDKWLGSPLRVHRRCIDPMFGIANSISYDNMMEYGTLVGPRDKDKQWLGESCWVDVASARGRGHWIAEQGHVAVVLLKRILALEYVSGHLFDEDGHAHVYVIAPFSDVASEMNELLARTRIPSAKSACGTIHTFQGKEADVVILLLGGDLAKPGAISGFAAEKPNLLNVALTRAKRRVYVVGQRDQWARHRFFDQLAEKLPTVSADDILAGPPHDHLGLVVESRD